MLGQRRQLLRAAVGFVALLMPSYDSRSTRSERGWTRGPGSGTSPSAWRVRAMISNSPGTTEGLARYLLHYWDGALADERDGHRMGAHAAASIGAGSTCGCRSSLILHAIGSSGFRLAFVKTGTPLGVPVEAVDDASLKESGRTPPQLWRLSPPYHPHRLRPR